jgi:hypothetical protein
MADGTTESAQSLDRPVEAAHRLAHATAPDPSGGDCWLWQRRLSHDGYGQVQCFVNGRSMKTMAHRVAWMAYRSEIPAGLQIDHLCRVRACCNPWHLEPVTNRVNSLRGAGRPRGCTRHGHENGYHWYDSDGFSQWICRICGRESSARRNARRRAARLATRA